MKTHLFFLMTVGLLATCSVNGQAQQPAPDGSYKQSCGAIKAEGGKLTATCNPKAEPYTILGGESFKGPSSIESFFECVGDISNQNGSLACNRNPNAMKLKNTRKAIDEAMISVLGIAPNGDADRYRWIGEMFKAGHQAMFYKQGGFQPKNTMEFFRSQLIGGNAGNMRVATVKQAFKDVYNLPPSNADLAKWTAAMQSNTATYKEVVGAEAQKMNSDKIIRRLMINNAYVTAFGRPASAGDFDYWLPRTEIFKDLLAAQRTWLYSSNGAKDLTETVIRAWERKNGSPPKDLKLFGAALEKAKAGKLIFSEM